MKHKRVLQYLGVTLLVVLTFLTGFYCGTEDYKSDLIAVKHIDGKYGKAFYGVTQKHITDTAVKNIYL